MLRPLRPRYAPAAALGGMDEAEPVTVSTSPVSRVHGPTPVLPGGILLGFGFVTGGRAILFRFYGESRHQIPSFVWAVLELRMGYKDLGEALRHHRFRIQGGGSGLQSRQNFLPAWVIESGVVHDALFIRVVKSVVVCASCTNSRVVVLL